MKKTSCPVCGDPVPKRATGRPRIYCEKRKCRDEAWRSGAAKENKLTKDARLRDEIARTMKRATA